MGLWQRLRKLWASWIVNDVPASIYGCEICGSPQCSHDKFDSCDFRLKCEKSLETVDSTDTSTSDQVSDYDQCPDTAVAVSGTRTRVSDQSPSLIELPAAKAECGRK